MDYIEYATTPEDKTELGREFLVTLRTNPRVQVKVRGISTKPGRHFLGRTLWFPRTYVVQDDESQRAHQASWLARREGIALTRIYKKKPTTKDLDRRLIDCPDAIFV